MSEESRYFYIENLGLNATQKATLVAALRALVSQDDPQPVNISRMRPRPDNEAAIFAGMVDSETHLTAAAVKTRLVALLGVPAANVTYATTQTAFGPAVTFKYNTANKLRLGVFGGIDADWGSSLEACRAFMAANAAAWEEV